MMKHHKQFSLGLCLLLLAACATQGPPVALDQRLGQADAAINAIVALSTDMRKGGLISDKEWPIVKDILKTAHESMVEAWAAFDADPGDAEDTVTRVEAVLKELQARLLNRREQQIQQTQ